MQNVKESMCLFMCLLCLTSIPLAVEKVEQQRTGTYLNKSHRIERLPKAVSNTSSPRVGSCRYTCLNSEGII